MKRIVLLWFSAAVVGLYTTFVIEHFWNWFATPAFRVPEVSFWETYGLVLLISLFTNAQDREFIEDQRWKIMWTAVDACIPETKQADVRQQVKEQADDIWLQTGLHVFAKAFGNTFLLALGFAVHAMLM